MSSLSTKSSNPKGQVLIGTDFTPNDVNFGAPRVNTNNGKIDDDLGLKIAMHIAASNPLSIDKHDLNKEIIEKEEEIIKEELKNSGKKGEIIEKISTGKLNKFIEDNTLNNQAWIIDPKKKVSEILKEDNSEGALKVIDFVRYKVGEGV